MTRAAYWRTKESFYRARIFAIIAVATAFAAFVTGCSSQQLAKDEEAVAAALQKADDLVVSGAAAPLLQAGAQELLQADPSSPVVQRAAQLVQQASTPAGQVDAHVALQGGIVLMKLGPVVQAAAK